MSTGLNVLRCDEKSEDGRTQVVNFQKKIVTKPLTEMQRTLNMGGLYHPSLLFTYEKQSSIVL